MAIIIGISGKKQSGKSSLANYLRSAYWVRLNKLGHDAFVQLDDGNIQWSTKESDHWSEANDLCEVFSFADPLKQNVCMDVLGLSNKQCYGTDKDKNSLTKYSWDDLPMGMRLTYSVKQAENGNQNILDLPRTGKMSGREVMQVVGTDIFRQYFSQHVWVDATFKMIATRVIDVALISDVRFESEKDAILEADGYMIRLNRRIEDDEHPSEKDLDDVVWGDRCCVIDNDNKTMQEKNKIALDFFEDILDNE